MSRNNFYGAYIAINAQCEFSEMGGIDENYLQYIALRAANGKKMRKKNGMRSMSGEIFEAACSRAAIIKFGRLLRETESEIYDRMKNG